MTTLLALIAVAFPQMPPEALDAWADGAGLQVVRMHTTTGDVVVYLPARFSAGDYVSGAIYLEPAGARLEAGRNGAVLATYSLDVLGSRVSLKSSQFSGKAPAGGSPISLVLRREDGGEAGSKLASSRPQGVQVSETIACPVVEHGTAIRVVGSFDGNRESTMVWIDGVPAGIVAEGSRDCVVSTMDAQVGPHTLRIKEGGADSQHRFSVVTVVVEPPIDARIGRKTAIAVTVDGLEDAVPSAFPLKVVLSNDRPKLFPFGETVELAVDQANVNEGAWTGRVEFKPRGKGEYSMRARLVCESFLRRIGN